MTVEYLIAADRAEAFAEVMRGMRRQRLRDGALRWGLFHDPLDPQKYLETFVVESWAEHMRQHERVTVSDRDVEERALAFHIANAPPVVTHLISAYADELENKDWGTLSDEGTLPINPSRQARPPQSDKL